MATYKKNGARIIKVEENFSIKKHLKEFRKMMKLLAKVANELYSLDVDYSDDNIDMYTMPYITRELDEIERSILLSKINSLRNESRDNT